MTKIGGHGRNAALIGFCLLALAVILAVGAPAQALPASEAPVYAIDNYPFQKAPALLRWRSVQQREARLMQGANPDDCKGGEPRIACAAKEVLLLEEKLQDKAPAEQVAAVYAYFNAIKYKEHAPQCGIDCWKSRLEFVADREGDCGDHALAEYFTLKRLGFKERDLQLIVAQLPGFADSFKGGHVVLRVRAEGDYFILDNRRTELAELSDLRQYKVLAGMNADSVQIYNLVTDTPPPGAVADAGRFITSPGAATETQVAEAAPEPAPAPAETFDTQSQPTIVAAAEPAAPVAAVTQVAATASAEEEAETMCMQTAQLSDWNPMMPCTEVVKTMKIVIKPKTIIGAVPPKSLDDKPGKPVEVAAATKVPEPKVDAPKTPEAKTATKPVVVTPAPKPEAVATKADEAEEEVDSCMQGATLGDWNPDLPCTEDGNSSSLRIQFSD